MAVVPLPPEFRLERYFALHEFSARHLLCCSDAEALSMADLLAMADEEGLKLWNELKLSYTESQGTYIWLAESTDEKMGLKSNGEFGFNRACRSFKEWNC